MEIEKLAEELRFIGMDYPQSEIIRNISIFDQSAATLTAQQQEIAALRAENARLREADRWIPVSERLPEVDVDVLVKCKNKSTFVAYHRKWEYDDGIVWNTRGPLGSGRRIATTRITHWRPLPEAPEKGE